MPFRPALAPSAALCAVGASLLLAACGGSGPNATATQENEEDFVKFARCLREHGVNVSTGSGKGQIRINGTNPTTMNAAQNACKRYQPSGGKENLTPQERVAREEAVLKFAKCMREHGINVHASTAGGSVRIGIESHGGGPNPESPGFQAAQKACQGLLPFKGGPGGRTPDGGPSTSSAKPGSGSGSGASLQLGG
jgi:hypothetical protein